MRAIIVEVLGKNTKTKIPETKELAKSLGYEIIKEVIQVRKTPDHRYLVGIGKLKELKELVKEENVKTIIFTNTLKANQAFRIRKVIGWNINVIDRNLLILEVFERRSRTAEAKMQIELARLYYMLPWVKEYLRSRDIYGEQVGWGALGEYLHKLYEQHIMNRIRSLEKKLKGTRLRTIDRINKRKEQGFLELVLTGYTQAGKTELFNKLTGENKPVGLGPFTTLSTYARRLYSPQMNGNNNIIVIDSIGFIEDLHPIILNAFYTTLHELSLSDLIILVIDGSESVNEIRRKTETSQEIINNIALGREVIIALNKIDLINEEKIWECKKIIGEFFPYNDIIPISAKKDLNLDMLIKRIVEKFK
ncbi:MAG: GTPase HflX [Candidatus Methanomethylicia archaeon]|nr:GTPase HflX [Candidatus Methanomethylicia archaeon]MCX8169089.1 GTPase HflX [Candidatus Methanomethylicia archaeon]MDW7988821.1 GTPase HflX [Nitrososphaerota archaeon]